MREFRAEGTAWAEAWGERVLNTRSANLGFLRGLADQRDGPWGGPGLAEWGRALTSWNFWHQTLLGAAAGGPLHADHAQPHPKG